MAVWLFCLHGAHAIEKELRFGIFPNLSPKLLVETYQPVAEALSQSLKRPVTLQTAPDFKTFFERTQSGDYDLVLTGPHLAWLAIKEADYRPLLAYQRNTEGILVVKAGNGFKSPGDLRGKKIVLADSLAITVMRMENELARSGLLSGRDYTRFEVGSHNNAAIHVHEGRSDAAIMGGLPFQRLPDEMRKSLRIIKSTQSFPSQVYLTHPRVSQMQTWAIRDALKDFMQSSQGKVFLRQGGFEGLRTIGNWELRQFEADAQFFKQRLQAGQAVK